MKKKVLIALVALIVLTISATAIILKVVSNKNAKEIEKSINLYLDELIENDFISSYEKFNCGGFIKIKCESNLIKINSDIAKMSLDSNAQNKEMIEIRNNVIDIFFMPKTIKTKITSILYINNAEINNDNNIILSIDDKTGAIEINSVYNSYTPTIKMSQSINTGFVSKDFIDKNFIKIRKEYLEDKNNYVEKIIDNMEGISFKSLSFSFQGEKLADDLIQLLNEATTLPGNLSNEEVKTYVKNKLDYFNNNMSTLGDSEFEKVKKEFISNLYKVFNDEVNYIDLEISNKDKDENNLFIDYKKNETIFDALNKISLKTSAK